MYLDAVNQTSETSIIETNGSDLRRAPEVFEKWRDWHPSQISHHGQMCCEIAREWITATDFSDEWRKRFTGPRWRGRNLTGAHLRSDFLVRSVGKTLDCGALAALAHEFLQFAAENFRVQLIQRFSEVATNQGLQWREDGDAKLR